jgi:hypothetical protein
MRGATWSGASGTRPRIAIELSRRGTTRVRDYRDHTTGRARPQWSGSGRCVSPVGYRPAGQTPARFHKWRSPPPVKPASHERRILANHKFRTGERSSAGIERSSIWCSCHGEGRTSLHRTHTDAEGCRPESRAAFVRSEGCTVCRGELRCRARSLRFCTTPGPSLAGGEAHNRAAAAHSAPCTNRGNDRDGRIPQRCTPLRCLLAFATLDLRGRSDHGPGVFAHRPAQNPWSDHTSSRGQITCTQNAGAARAAPVTVCTAAWYRTISVT